VAAALALQVTDFPEDLAVQELAVQEHQQQSEELLFRLQLIKL
jgi:hypothetical protein